MLGAALAMLVLVSTFVAFGSWPGADNGKRVDQVLLNEVVKAKPQAVAVRADAITVARRAELRRAASEARKQRGTRTGARTPAGNKVAQLPGKTGPGGTSVGATSPATAPATSPADAVKQQTRDVTQNLDTTTRDVGTQVQQQVDQTTTQVNEVVDQVVGGVQQQAAPVTGQVQDTVDNTVGTVTGAVDTTVGTVKDTAGGLLGH